MLILEILEKEYELAESWDEVTVEKFEKLSKHNGVLKEYKSQTLFTLELYSILLDCDVDVIKKLNREAFNELSELTKWTSTEIEKKNVNQFSIGEQTYIAINDFNKLKMGDNVSLELTINDSNEHNLLSNILPIIIRPAKVDGQGNLIPGDFDADNYNQLKELFSKNLNVADILHLSNFFFGGEKISSITTKASLVKGKKKK